MRKVQGLLGEAARVTVVAPEPCQALEDLAAEGMKPILEYQFETEQGGRRFLVQEVYLNSAEFVGGSTIQLIEFTPL